MKLKDIIDEDLWEQIQRDSKKECIEPLSYALQSKVGKDLGDMTSGELAWFRRMLGECYYGRPLEPLEGEVVPIFDTGDC